MKTLCVVSEGSKKIWDIDPKAGPTNSRDAYVGPLTKKCIEYAEIFHPYSWCILSANYGFLLPDDTVPGPYHASFGDDSAAISKKELWEQIEEKELDEYEMIIVLAGKEYVDVLNEVFSQQKIVNPLNDCEEVDCILRKLNDAIENVIPL